jgi:glycosyltransferase involved in cell wall biosynthesis
MTMGRPMRVALLATSVEFGGIERVLLNLVQHMEPGVELVPLVFTRTDIKETSFFDRLQALGVSPEMLYVNSIWPQLVLNPLVNLGQIIALVRKRGFDLIHSHGYRADAFALPAAKCCAVPVVSTVHGLIGNDSRLRLYNAIDRRILRFFTRVIAVSGAIKDDLLAHRVSADRVHVVANAVTPVPENDARAARREMRADLGIGESDFVFGYVGRLSPEKGVRYLIDAAAQLAAARSGIRLLIVGDGSDRGQLEQAAQDGALRGRVTFAGFQSDTSPWYSAMDVLVLPSLTEGTPMTLLESMAIGVPAIASRVGGVPSVVADGDNGILVEPGSARDLHQAMARVAIDTALRVRIAEHARQSIREHYNVQSWIRQTVAVYDAALSNPKRLSTDTQPAYRKCER